MTRTPRTLSVFLLSLLLMQLQGLAQKRWDGGAGDGQWSSPLNWFPDGVPSASDDVLLDNDLVLGSYVVTFPAGNTTVTVNSISIKPLPGDSILLDIPTINTAGPALNLNSAADALVLESGATLRNGSGAPSGESILLAGRLAIHNGGRYLHRTARANAYLIDHLLSDSSTLHGVFEFDVPGTAGYTVSLTGNVFGDLVFSASGGTKSYSGSGATELNVRGHLVIGAGAQLTSTLSADIRIGGMLSVEGVLNLSPSTAGITGRRVLFTGAGRVSGAGPISPGMNFRGYESAPGSSVILNRYILLPGAGQSWWLRSGAMLDLGGAYIGGAGAFHSESGATLHMGDAAGITLGDSGNLRTAVRQLDTGMTYIYDAAFDQHSGNALPPNVAALVIDKAAGQLTLSVPVETRRLDLMHGDLVTGDSSLLVIGPGGIHSPTDVRGRNDEGWEGSHVVGPCQLHTTGPGTWRAPTGSAGRFAPIALRRTGSGDVRYTVQYHPTTPPASIGKGIFQFIDDREFWSLSSSGVSPDRDAHVDLSWDKDHWPLIDSMSVQSIRIAGAADTSNGVQWVPRDAHPLVESFGRAGWVHSDLVNSGNGLFTLGEIMPAAVLAMTGQLECRATGDGNSLRWSGTLPEGKEMIPEFSTDGVHYQVLNEKPAMDGTFIDHPSGATDTWYRISFPGKDGVFDHSNTCRVRNATRGGWKLSPQPAWATLNVEAPKDLKNVHYRLMDLSGRLLQSGPLPDGRAWVIRMDHPRPGLCVLEMIHAGGRSTREVIMGTGL